MRLATRSNGDPDGALMVVARDGARWLSAAGIAANLQQVLEVWNEIVPALRALGAKLDGDPLAGVGFDLRQAACPLPRAYQWLDGSAYLAHGRLMQRAFKLASNPQADAVPLMYQGGSDRFVAPCRCAVCFGSGRHRF